MKKYFQDIFLGITTVLQGMRLTFRHLIAAKKRHKATNVNSSEYFKENTGIVTLKYPYEQLPVPDHGRYQLFNEIDDCIVCDKCAVICPVNCIAIDAIKSPEPIGETSDGSVKRLYAATFDIDMAKCCFCGLCTSVCPTECLTMTNTYDFSTYTVKEMNFEFANLSKEEAHQKRKIYEQFMLEKEQLKAEKPTIKPDSPKPTFKPVIKLAVSSPKTTIEIPKEEPSAPTNPAPSIPKPVGIKPIIKPVIKSTTVASEEIKTPEQSTTTPEVKKPVGLKPIIKPVIKKPEPPANS
jgi:formate hydrogenlyase subunit 6/NADH:ubiquinone oxidoreductase subunit I